MTEFNKEGRPMLIVSEYSTRAEFEELRSDWASLLEIADNASIFTSWEWVEAFWQHGTPGKQPLVLAARDSRGSLVGLLPLAQVDRLGIVRIIEVAGCSDSGYPVGDYGGPIMAAGMESVIWRAMLSYLKLNRWSVIDMRNCPAGDTARVEWLTRLYESATSDHGWKTRVQTADVCRLIPLPNTFEGYLATLSSNSRQNLRRKLRKFTEAGLKIVEVDTQDEAARAEALQALFTLHQQRWAHNPSGGAFPNEQMRALHKYLAGSLAAQGKVDIRVALSAEGQIIGVIYNFRRGGMGYFYSIGTSSDPKWANLSLGVCLLASSIRGAIEAGCHTFDLLRGDHEYKAHFGGYTVSNLRVTMYRYGWLPKLQAIAASVSDKVKPRGAVRLEGSVAPE